MDVSELVLCRHVAGIAVGFGELDDDGEQHERERAQLQKANVKRARHR